ncbi:MAG TPA: DUF3854 domain-containing protein [Pyrinomonadaceae bacterium]|jgi:hypothetical protein
MTERAPADIINGILTYILRKGLTLKDEHRTQMRVVRGLSGEWIDSQVYRSTFGSEAERDAVAELAAPYLDAFGGGVPGFYHDGRRWRSVYTASGIFIPARDEYGRIQALAYRLDSPRDGCKYIWWSSNPETVDDAGRQKYPLGGASGAPVHFANRPAMWGAEELTVVEGTLKADICAALSGLPVVGVAGVNNTRGLAERLCRNLPHLRRVNVAFDKDVFSKPQVADALERLVTQLEAERFTVRVRMWPGEAKGFDDFLLSQIRDREVVAR